MRSRYSSRRSRRRHLGSHRRRGSHKHRGTQRRGLRRRGHRGGRGCGNTPCPIAPLSVAEMNRMGGGSWSLPGPFVGQPWTPSPSGWPGADGVGGDRNYLSAAPVGLDPAYQMRSQVGESGVRHGGRGRTGRGRTGRRGGGVLPQDLVNIGRSAAHSLSSAYHVLSATRGTPSPLPFEDQGRLLGG
jgi:hypothetical protein